MTNTESLIDEYKQATGDYLGQDQDGFQKFVEAYVEEHLRNLCDIRFEGKPNILTSVLNMHRALNPEEDERLIQFKQSGIEITSVDKYSTILLNNFIPSSSYLTYIIENGAGEGGFAGVKIDDIIDFCKIGSKEAYFRYRFDSQLKDFYIQYRGLRRKFHVVDPMAFPEISLPEISYRCRGQIKLKEFKDTVVLASKLNFDSLMLDMNFNQLNIYGTRAFGEENDSIDEMNEMVSLIEWNGENARCNYSVPLLKGILEMLTKRYDKVEVQFSDDGPMRLGCGNFFESEEDDEFATTFILAPRIEETENDDDEDDDEEDDI